MDNGLSVRQAYKVMYEFLRNYYYAMERPEALGSLLSDLQLLDYGGPADPAAWEDWLMAVQKVLDNEKSSNIKDEPN